MISRALCMLFGLLWAAIGIGSAQVAIPDTPAGHTLEAWLEAFNSSDRTKIEAYIKTTDPNQSLDGMIAFRGQTGGFDLLSIESSEALHIRFLVKGRSDGITPLGSIAVKDAQAATVTTFSVRALPRGVTPVDVV